MWKKTPKPPPKPSPFWRRFTSWRGLLFASITAGILFALFSLLFLTYGFIDLSDLSARVDEEANWLRVFGHLAAFRREATLNVLEYIGLHLLWLAFNIVFIAAPFSTILLIIMDGIRERRLTLASHKILTFIIGSYAIAILAITIAYTLTP